MPQRNLHLQLPLFPRAVAIRPRRPDHHSRHDVQDVSHRQPVLQCRLRQPGAAADQSAGRRDGPAMVRATWLAAACAAFRPWRFLVYFVAGRQTLRRAARSGSRHAAGDHADHHHAACSAIWRRWCRTACWCIPDSSGKSRAFLSAWSWRMTVVAVSRYGRTSTSSSS